MGRLVLVEGLDLAGKSTLIQGLERLFRDNGWLVEVSHGDLCPNNPVAKVTRQMMRWDPGFSKEEGAPLFLASHLWDERHFVPPTEPGRIHIQDSCALRSLAFERVLGQEFYARRLAAAVDRLPDFHAAYALTASMNSRVQRFSQRAENDLHDSFMLSDPVRFAQVDAELLRLTTSRFQARLICTDELDPEALLALVWNDLNRKFGGLNQRSPLPRSQAC
jgi:thymidylate kinase